MRHPFPSPLPYLLVGALCAACSAGSDSPAAQGTDAGAGGAAGAAGADGASESSPEGAAETGGETGAVCAKPTPVPCSDQVIQQLNLKKDPAPGAITNQVDGSGWLSVVDATAGGSGATNPTSYVYANFGTSGLDKVAISDVDSLDSMDWDVAFRRYVIRVNSGHSGPSCVGVAKAAGSGQYDAVASLPSGLSFAPDQYFTAACALVPDGSGLPNSPATQLAGFWKYDGCVKMTGLVYALRLRDGRSVKLTVTSYYSEAAQKECEATSKTSGDGSGTIRMRWAFLP